MSESIVVALVAGGLSLISTVVTVLAANGATQVALNILLNVQLRQ